MNLKKFQRGHIGTDGPGMDSWTWWDSLKKWWAVRNKPATIDCDECGKIGWKHVYRSYGYPYHLEPPVLVNAGMCPKCEGFGIILKHTRWQRFLNWFKNRPLLVIKFEVKVKK
jgi:hypothetical protein